MKYPSLPKSHKNGLQKIRRVKNWFRSVLTDLPLLPPHIKSKTADATTASSSSSTNFYFLELFIPKFTYAVSRITICSTNCKPIKEEAFSGCYFPMYRVDVLHTLPSRSFRTLQGGKKRAKNICTHEKKKKGIKFFVNSYSPKNST